MISQGSSQAGEQAVSQIPNGLFVMTSSYEGRSAAVPVRWVQQCATNPPMVMVALAKGQHIEPILRDSRWFALCQVSAEDRFMIRKFGHGGSNGEDATMTMATSSAPSGAPILERAMSYVDCEIVRHVELDCDFRIYVGQVHRGAVLRQATPAISYGTNGASGK